MKYGKFLPIICICILVMTATAGCGREREELSAPERDTQSSQDAQDASKVSTAERSGEDISADSLDTVSEAIGIANETAEDAHIDFAVLKEENPDIFAWVYIPGTGIDYPVLQSEEADDFYEYHNAYGEADDSGAIYIELANLASMCDFNTVLHGKTGTDENGLFADLYHFADPDFFKEHEQIYIYLEGNVLTYEVFAAYERENTSLIRTYDFTYLSGCEQFLNDLYATRDMSMNLRQGWEDVTPYHFLITLTTQKDENAEKQFVVIAALMQDAAGTIDRVVTE